MKKCVIWVRPRLISHYCLPPHKETLRYLKAFRLDPLAGAADRVYKWLSKGTVFGGSWDLHKQPIEEHPTCLKMADLLANIDDFRKSAEFRKALQQVGSEGSYRHKHHVMRSEAELEAFFGGYLVPLLTSMRDTGYIDGPGSGYPGALIDRNGAIIKSRNGRHRFFAAWLLRPDDPIPLRIDGVHRDYVKARSLRLFARPRDLSGMISAIEESYRMR